MNLARAALHALFPCLARAKAGEAQLRAAVEERSAAAGEAAMASRESRASAVRVYRASKGVRASLDLWNRGDAP